MNKHVEENDAANDLTSSRVRILVVDDNRDAAFTLSILLRSIGKEVRTAHDGLEAIELSRTFLPDVIFLDIGLPRLNGYEVARRIRAQDSSANIMLIALSGWSQDDPQIAKDAGIDHYFIKPISFSAIKKVLNVTASTDT